MTKICKTEVCDRKHYARGWCKSHYARWRRGYETKSAIKTPEENAQNAYGKIDEDLAPTESPTVRDLEWAAGFLEGDGHFGRTKGSQIVSAGQKNHGRECLERLRSLFGGSMYEQKEKDFSTWYVNGARARGVMMTLYKLMSKRRQKQIKGAL